MRSVFSGCVLATVLALFTSAAFAQTGDAVAVVSAANYEATVAPDSVAALFGVRLANQTQAAATQPLPTTLAGVTVRVNGEAAPLFFVSAGQINFAVPSGIPAGMARVVVTTGEGATLNGTVQVATVAPGLFTANGNGQGVVAALSLRVANGRQTYEPLLRFDDTEARFLTRPLYWTSFDQLYLVLYLTGIRHAAPQQVRVSLGGVEFVPAYVGPAPGLVGLDQLNLLLPPVNQFAGRGRINLEVRAEGNAISNAGEIELGGLTQPLPVPTPPLIFPTLSVSGAPVISVLAGAEIEIAGCCFAGTPSADSAAFVRADGLAAGAEVLSPSSVNRVRLRVPYGAGGGNLHLANGALETSLAVSLRTSLSGVIETTRFRADNSYERLPLAGARLRVATREATTNADGFFLLPDLTAGDRVEVELLPPANWAFTPSKRFVMRVQAGYDNQLPRFEDFFDQTVTANATEANSMDENTANSQLAAAGFTVTYMPEGRAVGVLPRGHFSRRIVAVTPFEQTMTPGAKLSLQNADGLAPNEVVPLYRLEQRSGSATLGQWRRFGNAVVTANGLHIESADPITEGGYYFASRLRPTAAVSGRVIYADGAPAPRTLVQVRGQAVYTDGNGGFALTGIPVMQAAGERLALEISSLQPNGAVLRNDAVKVDLRGGAKLALKEPIVLPRDTRNQPPLIFAASNLRVAAGEPREFDLFIRDADSEAAVRTALAGTAATFATMTDLTAGRFRLRLAPTTAQTLGDYALDLTATDGAGASATQRLTINVYAATANPQPYDLSLVTPEDTPLTLTLSGRNITSDQWTRATIFQPARGRVSGTPPNLSFTPARDFNGLDSFSYLIANTSATVQIAVSPVNDAPQLNVPTAPLANVGAPLRLLAQASDADGANTVQLAATNLPTGASFTANGGQGLLQWTPTLAQLGGHTINVTARDQATQVNQNVNVSVVGQWAKTSGPPGGSIGKIIRYRSFLYGLSNGEIYRSTDNGLSWVEFQGNLAGKAIDLISGHGNAMVAADQGSILAPGKTWRSFNAGLTWEAFGEATFGSMSGHVLFRGTHIVGISSGGLRTFCDSGTACPAPPHLPTFPIPQAFFVQALFSNGPTLFVHTQAHQLRWQAGNEWQELILPALDGNNASWPLAAGRTLLSYVLNASGGYVLFRSDDDGSNWTRIATPFPATPDRTFDFKSVGQVIYLGTEQKVWRSLNFGQTWEDITGNLAGQRLGELNTLGTTLRLNTNMGEHDLAANGQWALLPRAPLTNSNVSLIPSGSSLIAYDFGSTAYRSEDRGQSWASVRTNVQVYWGSLQMNGNTWFANSPNGLQRSTDKGVTWSYANIGAGSNNTRLVIVAPQLLFAQTATGLFRSTDDARTWTPANTGLPATTVNQMLAVGNAVYALTANQVFRSTNSGQSWALAGRIEYNVSLLQSNGTSLFAMSSGPPPLALVRSNDQGATWQPIGPSNSFIQSNLLIDGATLYLGSGSRIYRSSDNGTTWASISRGITVSPVAGYTLYRWRNNLLALAFANPIEPNNNGIFLSNDQGETWRDLAPEFRSRALGNLVWLDDELFLSTQGSGVYRMAGTTLNWTPSNRGIAESYTNAVIAQHDTLFAATLNGVFRSTDQGVTWTPTNNGLPTSADVRAFATNGATLWAAVWGGGVYRSIDNGANWTAQAQGLTDRNVSALFVSGTTLYAGTPSGVFRSLNGGNWAAFNAGLATVRVTAFALHNGALYAGTEGGQVARLNDVTWQTLTVNNAQGVTALLSFGTALYAATNGNGVIVSRDEGVTWTATNNGLPATLNAFGLAARAGKLYLGSIYGIFVSENNGASWQQANAGLPQIFVTGLAFSGNQLFVSAARGGVFSSVIE